MPSDSDAWRVTTDAARIREWADERGAVPVHDESATGRPELDVVDPDRREAAAGVDRITWDQFFELFEAEGLAFRYHEGADDVRCELVDRATVSAAAETEGGDGTRTDVASDRIVSSDTGEAEPIVDDRVESTSQRASAPGDRRDDRDEGPGNLAPKRLGESDDPDSPSSESASGAEEPPLVLEEIYEDPGGFDSDPDDEYVVLRNDGDQRLELAGWTVENGVGHSYRFPDGFVLEPNQEVTLHSGAGEDTETELYWGADEPVWNQEGGTVLVRTADDRQILREPYKDG